MTSGLIFLLNFIPTIGSIIATIFPAVIALAEKYDVDMPIAREVFQVVQDKSTAGQAFRGLLKTAAGAESDPG